MPDTPPSHSPRTTVPSLIYIHQFRFPTHSAAWIQITRTLRALADHADIVLVVGSLTRKRAQLDQAYDEYFGRPLGPRIKVVSVRRWLRRLSFPLMIRQMLASAPKNAAFYTRSFYTASKLLQYRALHRRKVLLESHRKMGFSMEDAVPGSRYAHTRRHFERYSEPHDLIRSVYREVDAVFFLNRHSIEVVEREVPLKDAEHLWYGLRCGPEVSQASGSSFVFCGEIREHKLIDLLIDALDLVRTDVHLSVYGGDATQVAQWREKIANRPCAGRVEFQARLRWPELQQTLRRYRFGLATQEGMKVVDYIENGVTPIVPDVPSYRDVFDERQVRFFQPDDPVSLAQALDTVTREHVYDPDAIRELCERYSLKRRAEKILARLR